MNNDWQLWHYFVVIAEQGSLSKAAQQLNLSQPTLSRQLINLEKAVGDSLFDRSTQGLRLTELGRSLLEEAQAMQTRAFALQRLVSGQADTLTGAVRLSVNENVAQYYLADTIAPFLDAHPQLSVIVDVSNKASNIDRRDTDMAVRMFKPTQLDIVSRHLSDIPIAFYASAKYIARFGAPQTPQQLLEHRLIGFDRDPQFEQHAQNVGWSLTNEQFAFRSDNLPLQFEVAKAGGGIVATHSRQAERAGLVKIDVGVDPASLPVFLVCHRDLYQNRTIRALFDYLASHLDFS